MTATIIGNRSDKVDEQCSERVWVDAWHKRQCTKKAWVVRDSKSYCTIHDPEYIKQKEAKQKAKYAASNCKKCGHHFQYDFFRFCPLCGTKRTSPQVH